MRAIYSSYMFLKALAALVLILPFPVSAQGTDADLQKLSVPLSSSLPFAGENSPIQMRSCISGVDASADGTLLLKRGEAISFSCTLANTGTTTLAASVSARVEGESRTASISSPVELKEGETVASLEIPPFTENGTYAFTLFLAGRTGEPLDKPVTYSGVLDSGIARITDAKISGGPFIPGETAAITLTISSDPGTLPEGGELSLGMLALGSDGGLCAAFVLPEVSGSLHTETFIVPENKSDCVISAVRITLRSKDGFVEDRREIPFTVAEKGTAAGVPWVNLALLASGIIGAFLVRTLHVRYQANRTAI